MVDRLTNHCSKYPAYYAERLLFRARELLDIENPKHLELKKSINQFLHDTAIIRNPPDIGSVSVVSPGTGYTGLPKAFKGTRFDPDSPLYGLTKEELLKRNSELPSEYSEDKKDA